MHSSSESRSARRHLAAMGMLALPMGLVAAFPASAVTCPECTMSFRSATPFTSTAAAFDSSSGMTGPVGGARVAYDFPAAEVKVYHCCSLGITSVTAVDAFDVTGVPPGTQVTVAVEMPIEGWILSLGCGGSGCWGNLRGTITAGGVSNQVFITRNIFAADSLPVSGTVALGVTLIAGQPTPIEFKLEAFRSAGGNHGAHGTGRFHFIGLPAGAGIVSCKGFGQVPLPTLRPSWGRLKITYR